MSGTGDYQKAVQGPDEIRWHRLAPQQLRRLRRALGSGDRVRKLRADSLRVSEKSSLPCRRPGPAVRSGLAPDQQSATAVLKSTSELQDPQGPGLELRIQVL